MPASHSRIEAADSAPGTLAEAGQFTDIVALMKDRLHGFSPAERRVAAIVLSDVPRAVEENIASLAARAGVSEPSVTRFCRAIGCRGVRDFKLKLAQCLVVGEAYLNADAEPATPDADLPAYWTPIMTDAHGALREVERRITPEDIQPAAAALAGAQQVITVGLGGSAATLAEEAQFRLFRYGVRVSCCPESYILRMTAATLGPGDLVLAISASGKTEELIEAVGLARAYGAQTIAITALASPLADAVDHALCVAVPETQDTLTPTSLRFAYLAIIDLLSAATGYALGPKARENLRRIKYTALNHRAGEVQEPLGD
ncbi:MurR/RpiR family transcriptional regulator [Psychromarinibacter sp. C21-152]|uniref:MurR/RpiR family transcriptional regulator n=1 Tax=Psychromarinibacter sediminicola TaxID=3033385 RepID=A0AAE3T8X2_9RHOB|nr:MurR/RpiR family transcriptional regulator [Psychromarinibacter sediminicola]MDF0601208.1 MurR/RpiR family transcriptional regulator [Psychromarinibacter sediminicola]